MPLKQKTNSKRCWGRDEYNIWAENVNWGPMKLSSIRRNKLKIGGVEMKFCVSDCTENAEYKSINIKDTYYLMEKGFSTTMKLQDECKYIPYQRLLNMKEKEQRDIHKHILNFKPVNNGLACKSVSLRH